MPIGQPAADLVDEARLAVARDAGDDHEVAAASEVFRQRRAHFGPAQHAVAVGVQRVHGRIDVLERQRHALVGLPADLLRHLVQLDEDLNPVNGLLAKP